MPVQPTILLIGLRGSGKSTLGKQLASRLGVDFIDLDDLTLKNMGAQTVAQAWQSEGEPAFRKAEADALRQAIEQFSNGGMGGMGGVIALGGGTPTAIGAEAIIREAPATTIYLRGLPALLRSRLPQDDDPNRPSLTGASPTDEIERVFNARDPLYKAIADHTIDLTAHEQPDATLQRCIGVIG